MKICLIAPIPPYRGGIAKYCHLLAQELEKRHDLLLLSYRRQYPALLYGKPQVDPALDAATIARQFRRVSYDLDSLRFDSWVETARRIETFAPALVILPWWVTYWTPLYLWLMCRFKRRGIPCLLLCINVYEHEDSALKKVLTRFVLRQADLMIVHSREEQAELERINGRGSVLVHLLPVFDYGSSPPARSGESLKLLLFGFIRPYKGLDVLLEALALARELDVTLRVVGEFWSGKEEYLRLVKQLDLSDRVEIIDRYVPDEEMSDNFGWADVVVLPYRETKTSGVIAAAYGYGKPVLATDVGGFSEVIHDGRTGKLVPPSDPGALAEGMRWFVTHRHLDFRAHIDEFVEKQMSWRSLVDGIERMIATTGAGKVSNGSNP